MPWTRALREYAERADREDATKRLGEPLCICGRPKRSITKDGGLVACGYCDVGHRLI